MRQKVCSKYSAQALSLPCGNARRDFRQTQLLQRRDKFKCRCRLWLTFAGGCWNFLRDKITCDKVRLLGNPPECRLIKFSSFLPRRWARNCQSFSEILSFSPRRFRFATNLCQLKCHKYFFLSQKREPAVWELSSCEKSATKSDFSLSRKRKILSESSENVLLADKLKRFSLHSDSRFHSSRSVLLASSWWTIFLLNYLQCVECIKYFLWCETKENKQSSWLAKLISNKKKLARTTRIKGPESVKVSE